MSGQQDFERTWLAKFSSCLDEIAGEEIRKEVMKGSERMSSLSGRWEEILQQPVEVEVLESVLQGGKVCKIAVHLPNQEQ